MIGKFWCIFQWQSLREKRKRVHSIITTMIQAKNKIGVNTVCLCMLSCVRLFSTPRTVAPQALLSMESSRQEYCSGLQFSTPGEMLVLVGKNSMANRTFPVGNLSNPDIKPMSLASPALTGQFFTIGATWAAPGNPFQNSCLENSNDRGVHGATKVGQDWTTGHIHTGHLHGLWVSPYKLLLIYKGKVSNSPKWSKFPLPTIWQVSIICPLM